MRQIKPDYIATATKLINERLRGRSVETLYGEGSTEERLRGHWIDRLEQEGELELSMLDTVTGETETFRADNSWFDVIKD